MNRSICSILGLAALLTASLPSTSQGMADLACISFTGPTTHYVGTDRQYSMTIANLGDTVSTGLGGGAMVVGFADGTGDFAYKSSTMTKGILDTRTSYAAWFVDTLEPGETATWVVTLTALRADDLSMCEGPEFSPGRDSNEANNQLCLHVMILPPPADLCGSWNAVSLTSGRSSQCSIAGSLLVKNDGGASAANVTVSVYLSANNTWDSSDGLLVSRKVSKLDPGASRSLLLKKKMAGPLSGLYLMAVIDPGGTVSESNKANNSVAFGPLP